MLAAMELAACSFSTWLGLLLVAAAFLLVSNFAITGFQKRRKLPRGPLPFPIIGSLHLIGKTWHVALSKLCQKYGPIFFLQLGSQPVVVVSSPTLAKEIFITQDLLFAQRPHGEAVERLFYGGTTLGTMPNGPHWRDMRKFYMLELLHPKRLQAFKDIREQEVSSMLLAIAQQSREGNVVNLSQQIAQIPLNILLRMVMTKISGIGEGAELANDLRRKTGEMHDLWVAPAIGDFIPYLKWMDWRIHRRMDAVHKSLDWTIQQVILQRRNHKRENDDLSEAVEDFLDLLISNKVFNDRGALTDSQIKGVIQDILAAGSDVTTGSVEWAMAEILCKPPVLQKLREEVDQVVGGKRRVDESDLSSLAYLQAVVKEVYRLHPPAPVIVRQGPDQVCNIGGYEIPRKARVLVNVQAIGRDGGIWEEPEKFKPERFVGSRVDVRGLDMELLPFGAGRRGCVGMNLGLGLVELLIASLVQAFDWSLSIESGEDQPLKKSGPFLRKAQPLMAFATPRMPPLTPL